jgi:SMI1 / KNR4 family (SUKH-1)
MDKKTLLNNLKKWAEVELPTTYLDILNTHGGKSIGDSVLLYALEDLLERNETFEVKQYCPGHMTIGDDGGGRAILIPLNNARCPVFVVDQGSMDPDDFETISDGLQDWVADGCSLD